MHALDEPFVAATSGPQCVARFSFVAQNTNMLAALACSVQTLLAARRATGTDLAQLVRARMRSFFFDCVVHTLIACCVRSSLSLTVVRFPIARQCDVGQSLCGSLSFSRSRSL